MSKQIFSNNASTTLASPITAVSTSLVLTDAAKFDAPTGGDFLLVTIESSGVIEVIKISAKSSNTLTVYSGVSGRGQEGTVANSFPAGAIVEARTTKGSLESFLPINKYLPKIASVDNLAIPSASEAVAYFAGEDDGGRPNLAHAVLTDVLWKFPGYTLIASSAATSGTTTTAVSPTTLTAVTAGKFIIQFTNGANQGLCRAVTSFSGSTIGWTTALPVAVGTETFEVYQSTYSLISEQMAALVIGGGGGLGAWSNVTTYTHGEVVSYTDFLAYRAKDIGGNLNKPPASEPNYWERWGHTDSELTTLLSAQSITKTPVEVVTTANITLSGLQTIDGYALSANDRVLVNGQTTGSQNGVYVASAGAWVRATDSNTSAKMASGTLVIVKRGTNYSDSVWLLSTDGTIVLDTTSLTFILVAKNALYAPTANPTFTGVVILDTGASSYITEVDLGDKSTAFAWDLATAQNAKMRLTGSFTMSAPTNGVAGKYVYIRIAQDATGNRLVTWPTANFKGMTIYSPSTTALAVDWLCFRCVDATTVELVGDRINVTEL